LDIEHQTFRLRDYHAFLHSIKDDAARFKMRQQAAFEAERERWAAAGLAEVAAEPVVEASTAQAFVVPPGCRAVRSPIAASVWSIGVESGDQVQSGHKLLVIEAMKMEVAVAAPESGTVVEVLCSQGMQVMAGQPLVLLRV
jgi:urea carboxylase